MTDESLSSSLSDGQMTDLLTYWAIYRVTDDTTTDWLNDRWITNTLSDGQVTDSLIIEQFTT